MSDLENSRAQRDARRSAARRSSGSTKPEQALIRHLGVELYRVRHRAQRAPEKSTRTADDETTPPGSGDR